jgi:hypothetical protein
LKRKKTQMKRKSAINDSHKTALITAGNAFPFLYVLLRGFFPLRGFPGPGFLFFFALCGAYMRAAISGSQYPYQADSLRVPSALAGRLKEGVDDLQRQAAPTTRAPTATILASLCRLAISAE